MFLHADSQDSDKTARVDAQYDLSVCYALTPQCWISYSTALMDLPIRSDETIFSSSCYVQTGVDKQIFTSC